jgi:hypothetical protein
MRKAFFVACGGFSHPLSLLLILCGYPLHFGRHCRRVVFTHRRVGCSNATIFSPALRQCYCFVGIFVVFYFYL